MHDYSIKLLAVVEGLRELGGGDDDDDDAHYCPANDGIRCMTELTAEGTNLLEEKDNIQKEEETNQTISLKKKKKDSSFSFYLKL